MNLEKLISIAATIVIFAASTGQLPRLIGYMHTAQLQLIQNTKASNWGLPILLKEVK